MDSWTDVLVPPANSAATLDVSLKITIWTGFDGAYGPRMQSNGDFGRGLLLLIANKLYFLVVFVAHLSPLNCAFVS